MKKTVIVLFAVMFMAHNLFSQTIGEQTWEKKYGFEEGLTQAFVIETKHVSEGLNDSQVLLALNSNAGTINTYKIDRETGAIGELLFKKVLEKKGTWGVGIIHRDHLAISFVDYGAFEILKINEDGSIGEKTYETNSFEKGISIVVPMYKGILLVKPNAGFAWLFDYKGVGLGDLLWQTQNWEKGMTSGISCHTGLDYAALTKPDGKFWLIDCNNKSAIVKYHTDKFSKGITTIASNPNSSNIIVLSDPSSGHQWGIKSVLTDVKVITDSPNWEKGLSVQALGKFESVYGADGYAEKYFLYAFKPEIGAVWVYKISRNRD